MTKTKECRGEKGVCPFLLLENSRPLSPPWEPQTRFFSSGTPDFLSTFLGIDSHIKSIPECCYYKSKEWFDFLQEIKGINQSLCSFFTLIKLCYTKALAWSSLVPGPEAKSSSSEITNLTEATGSVTWKRLSLGLGHKSSLIWYPDLNFPLVILRASLVAQKIKNLLQWRRLGFDAWVRRMPWSRNGYPLQYCCLESSIDRGAWWATIHGFTKSQTQLSK